MDAELVNKYGAHELYGTEVGTSSVLSWLVLRT